MYEAARPRLAIVGGGGAMGRLFARYLAPLTRELDLIDFFGSGNRPASLVKTLDDIAAGAVARGHALDAVALTFRSARDPGPRVEASAGQGMVPGRQKPRLPEAQSALDESSWWVSGPVDAYARAAIGRFGHASGEDLLLPVGAVFDDLAATLSALPPPAPSATDLFAAGPAHAPELLPRADIVLLALAYENDESFARTLRAYLPWVRPGAVVVDLGSTKTGPMAVLEREVPPEVDVVGAHPLFGPIVADLTGLIVAAIPPAGDRVRSPWRDWFFDALARLRVIVTPTSAVEHDDAMAFVQALTHFALLSFAYTFVRLDRDPIDLLALRTPVFEPLLYLAARVAYLAGTNPETYRSIQAFSTRPDARRAFLDAARELLDEIDAATNSDAASDRLVQLFRRFGAPWAPDQQDRRERERREHLLDMGGRLVDGLNHLRQEFVTAVGEVRAVEERRAGQPPRVVVGIVDLDLLAPGKQDVASRIRLRRLNLPLGSVLGQKRAGDATVGHVIPLARARILSDDELLDWLFHSDQLVHRRSVELSLPAWFDRDVLIRLLKGMGTDGASRRSQVWDVEFGDARDGAVGPRLVRLAIVIHPAELVEARRHAVETAAPLDREIAALDSRLAEVYAALRAAPGAAPRNLDDSKDRLKRERKALHDQRAAAIDRAVRAFTHQRVAEIVEATMRWLREHGGGA